MIGTAFIAVANFVGWLKVQAKELMMLILLSPHYLYAPCVNENVSPYGYNFFS